MAQRDRASNQLIEHAARHQEKVEWATTSTGTAVPNLTASLSIGPRGPLLLQDAQLLEEIAHFDHERVPERVVYAKGAGAFGHFEATHDITRYTKAAVFENVGKRTPVVVRFSQAVAERGSADTVRDVRGFAVKFYSHDGVWDLVCNSTPTFFIRDPILYPSLIHAFKRNPVTNLLDKNAFWDFVTLRPETTHQLLLLFSDRGIPDGYRHMHGFGANTYKLVSQEEKIFYCKFIFKTNQGIKNLTTNKAVDLTALDPDYATRDLYNSIAQGDFPSWNLFIQVMTPEQADKLKWNPFDVTKVWPHTEFPLLPCGKLWLDRNPRNYFADVEEIAFSPSNLIPGVEPSPDKMLQARLFSYTDSQRYRIGPNFNQLPINCHAPVKNYRRDGPMCVHHNHDGEANYFPNSFNGPIPDTTHIPPKVKIEGTVDRYEHDTDTDFYSQPREFWTRVLDESAKDRLAENIADDLRHATEFIQQRALENFTQCHEDCANRIRQAMEKLKKREQEKLSK